MLLLKPKVLLMVAITLSLIATLVIYRFIKSQRDGPQASADAPQPVVLAAIDIVAGMRLEEQYLKRAEWPKNMLPPGSFSSIVDLVNRIARTDIVAGEPILEARLAPIGSSGGFSSLIPPGMRALTVSVNVVSGVSGFIFPGARVDVLVTVSTPSRREESTAKTILEDVQVLAVDQTFERENESPVKVQSVTLLVTPGQAEKLVLAASEGKLQLVLRNSADRQGKTTEGVQLRELMSGAKQPDYATQPSVRTPAKTVEKETPPAAPSHTVEIIRSNKREEVKFEKAPENNQPENP
jgi:pilus assembly protein CpaB